MTWKFVSNVTFGANDASLLPWIVLYQEYLWKMKTHPYHGVKKEAAFMMQ